MVAIANKNSVVHFDYTLLNMSVDCKSGGDGSNFPDSKRLRNGYDI